MENNITAAAHKYRNINGGEREPVLLLAPPPLTGCDFLLPLGLAQAARFRAVARTSGSGGGPKPIHPLILLEVPSVTVPVFLPVLGVTLAVPLSLLFLSLLPLLLLLSVLATLATLSWAPTASLWDRGCLKFWQIGYVSIWDRGCLKILEHRLYLNMAQGLSESLAHRLCSKYVEC